MDSFNKFSGQIKRYVFSIVLFSNLLVVGLLWFSTQQEGISNSYLAIIAVGLVALPTLILTAAISKYVAQPLKLLSQAILHVSPEGVNTPAPDTEQLRSGRELVTSLSMQVYQLASSTARHEKTNSNTDQAKIIVNSLPLPVIVVSKDQSVVFANEAAHLYFGINSGELVGKNIYSVLDLSFTSEHTLDAWLNEVRSNKVTASESWDRVRRKLPEEKGHQQFDMAAYYNKDNPAGVELILAFFDHDKLYSEDDQALSFVSLAVHELRTPLTLLRGYIEVFEDELDGKLDDELNGYLNKMQAASQHLTAFVNNILNVARLESDQLTLSLSEEKWAGIVKSVVSDLSLRAKIQNKSIEISIAPDLPTVAADRVSIYEVMTNLLDNALKYSRGGQKIIVRSYLTKDGLVETTVQDFGVGIPANILPNLFEKFYRNYRTQKQVGGTGLGLYLSKALITAHGGNIWVESKEGKGTTFGFTLKPYSMLADELKNNDNKDIVRGAHGWIKNHSLYRR